MPYVKLNDPSYSQIADSSRCRNNVGRGARLARQKACDLIVTDAALQQIGESRGGRLSKRTDQVIAVEIKECIHTRILHPLAT